MRGDVATAVARAELAPARARAVTAALLTAAAGADRLAEGTRLTAARPSVAGALRAAGRSAVRAGALAGYVVQLGLAGRALVGRRRAGRRWPCRSGVDSGGLIGALAAARLASSWAAGQLSIQTGAVLRSRVMDGILALDPEPLRAAGIGELMGRVADLDAVESLALGGGLAAAAGLFELLTGLRRAGAGHRAGRAPLDCGRDRRRGGGADRPAAAGAGSLDVTPADADA